MNKQYDPHTLRAAREFHVDPEEVTTRMRQYAKVLYYSEIYGLPLNNPPATPTGRLFVEESPTLRTGQQLPVGRA